MKSLSVFNTYLRLHLPFFQECTNVFSKGGGQSLAKEYHVPFLGKAKDSHKHLFETSWHKNPINNIFVIWAIQVAFLLILSSQRAVTKEKISSSTMRALQHCKLFRKWWTVWSRSTETSPEGKQGNHGTSWYKTLGSTIKAVHSVILYYLAEWLILFIIHLLLRNFYFSKVPF